MKTLPSLGSRIKRPISLKNTQKQTRNPTVYIQYNHFIFLQNYHIGDLFMCVYIKSYGR